MVGSYLVSVKGLLQSWLVSHHLWIISMESDIFRPFIVTGEVTGSISPLQTSLQVSLHRRCKAGTHNTSQNACHCHSPPQPQHLANPYL